MTAANPLRSHIKNPVEIIDGVSSHRIIRKNKSCRKGVLERLDGRIQGRWSSGTRGAVMQEEEGEGVCVGGDKQEEAKDNA